MEMDKDDSTNTARERFEDDARCAADVPASADAIYIRVRTGVCWVGQREGAGRVREQMDRR